MNKSTPKSVKKSQSTVGIDTSALDPTFKAHAFRGIGRYVKNLLSEFEKLPCDELIKNVSIDFFSHTDFKIPAKLDKLVNYLPCGRQTIRQQLYYPFSLGGKATSKFSFLHFPAHMDAPSWCPKPYIITSLDLIPLVCEDLYKAHHPGWRFKLARYLEHRALTQATFILAISECTANDLVKHLKIPAERIGVTHLGVDPFFFQVPTKEECEALIQKYSLSFPFFSYVGGIDQRKNVIGLFDIFKNALSNCSDNSITLPTLYIAGSIKEDKNYETIIEKANELGSQVKFLGYVSDVELRTLYFLSNGFLFASIYEGFGLPPLEAMATGAPIVCAKTSSLPEVLGSHALWYELHDTEKASNYIVALTKDKNAFSHITYKGKQHAETFTWSKTAIKTLEFYEKVAKTLRV
jgi:glycosyltransferase involved in cell wall biosynthesis